MMSRNEDDNVQFNFLHDWYRLQILLIESRAHFAKNSFLKHLIWIEISLISKMHILLKIINNMCLMFLNIFNTQLLIFIVERRNSCLLKSWDSRMTLIERSSQCTRRNVQVEMLNLNKSKIISHWIFLRIKHFIHQFRTHFLESIVSKFAHTTRSNYV
jgi:hypothetical protein